MDLSGLEASLVHLVSSRAVGQPESGLLVKLHASILRSMGLDNVSVIFFSSFKYMTAFCLIIIVAYICYVLDI